VEDQGDPADFGGARDGPGGVASGEAGRREGRRVALRPVPEDDGGRRDARRAETASQMRQEVIRTGDLRDQIEMEVRVALDSLRSAEQQVRAAREGLELAENELAQAQRRYKAGMSNSIEVTDAQTRLARARENHLHALFRHNLARFDLGTAMGAIRSAVGALP